MDIRIGSHPNNLSLFILRNRGVLENSAFERGWNVRWIDYKHGGDSSNLLKCGKVDVVGTGSTPPINAHASGLEVTYLASSPSRDASCALLAHHERPLSSLKGARLSAMSGSFTDHFLARLLLKQKLHHRDVDLVDIQGASALEMLRTGEIDGWLAIDPWLTLARHETYIVQLNSVGEEIINRSLFWTRSDWSERHPEAAIWTVEQLQYNDTWIANNLMEAASLLAKYSNSEIPAHNWIRVLLNRPWGIEPTSVSLLVEQQLQANDLFVAGFITEPVNLIHRRTA